MKKVFLFVLAVVMALTFAGCGNSVAQEEYDTLKANYDKLEQDYNAQKDDLENLQSKVDSLVAEAVATPTPSPTPIPSPTSSSTPESTIETTSTFYDNFKSRYNKFISEYNDANVDGTPLKEIAVLDEENDSFKPTSWIGFDIYLEDSGEFRNVILSAEGKATTKEPMNIMTTIGAMSAVAYAADADMTEEQRQDLASAIMQDFLLDDFSLDSVYETEINSYGYAFNVKFGYICMECYAL